MLLTVIQIQVLALQNRFTSALSMPAGDLLDSRPYLFDLVLATCTWVYRLQSGDCSKLSRRSTPIGTDMRPDGERMEASVISAESMAPDGSAMSVLLEKVWEEEDRPSWCM